MNPWWRDEPLTPEESELLRLVQEAHRLSALRPNASSQALLLAAGGSGNVMQAVAAAILTYGERHGPTAQATLLLSSPSYEQDVEFIVKAGGKVPGFGHSFMQGDDPIWQSVVEHLTRYFPVEIGRIDDCEAVLHRLGKQIYPNPAAYTAATAMALGIPAALSIWIVLSARIDVWMALIMGRSEIEKSAT